MSVPRLPYSMFVGQDDLKLALELNHIDRRIGGVLISGERGTGKSTIVRAFSQMTEDRMPVTLPINATEDRVVGGWKLTTNADGKQVSMNIGDGLLVKADQTVLYVDEVNLLEDHIVNMILDPTSAGSVGLARDGIDQPELMTRFTLVGTMNPEEGTLRPQLLDRFGLMVRPLKPTLEVRRRVLEAVLVGLADGVQLAAASAVDDKTSSELAWAKAHVMESKLGAQLLEACAELAHAANTEGSRAEIVMALAARAHAARRGSARKIAAEVTVDDVLAVAPMALRHRRKVAGRGLMDWSEADSTELREKLKQEEKA